MNNIIIFQALYLIFDTVLNFHSQKIHLLTNLLLRNSLFFSKLTYVKIQGPIQRTTSDHNLSKVCPTHSKQTTLKPQNSCLTIKKIPQKIIQFPNWYLTSTQRWLPFASNCALWFPIMSKFHAAEYMTLIFKPYNMWATKNTCARPEVLLSCIRSGSILNRGLEKIKNFPKHSFADNETEIFLREWMSRRDLKLDNFVRIHVGCKMIGVIPLGKLSIFSHTRFIPN